jgi:pyruvate dehydrogenase E1 component alpha subunit
VIAALDPDDVVVSTYREHGHALARGVPMDAVMAEMFGKEAGCSRGRGGSMHLFHKGAGLLGGNAIVGGGIPLAVGSALAASMRGRAQVTACFFGDGAAAEGEFHESLNLASLWRLPVLFCCENNRYAMGTAIAKEHARTNLAARAASYGIEAVSVDGMDVVAVEDAARTAVEAIRAGGGPRFLELETYRFRAHSMYDSDRYRDKAEIAAWKERDPIDLLTAGLRADGHLSDETLTALEAEIAEQIAQAVAYAEAAPLESVDDLTRFVCSEEAQP